MEDEKLLQALESAYNRGVTFEQIQGTSDEALIIAQDFYSKKDGTEDSRIASPSVSISEPSRESGASLSTQLGSDSQAISKEYSTLLRVLKREESLSDNLRAMCLKRRMI